MRDLAVLIPTRGRPGNIEKVISAWDFTNAWDVADMVLVADADDPEIEGYRELVTEFDNGAPEGQTALGMVEVTQWMPMVHKLNAVAREAATGGTTFFPNAYFALGFAGDDHLPQTINWAKRYLAVLDELGSGMVYGDDGYQGVKLCTEWAMTSDVIRALGRMVPADVEHMYCDNSVLDLFTEAGAVRHLPEVRIEHMHPITGKAETDEQYQRVNHRDQFKKDRAAYELWRGGPGFELDVLAVRNLRQGRPEERPVAEIRRISEGSGPRPVTGRRGGGRQVERSGPSYLRPKTSFGFPRHFRSVVGATPDEIGMTLADFAAAVPADQEIVELGVFQGRTALIMAWGASKGHGAHVTAIDPWDTKGNVYDPPFTDAASREAAHHNVMSLGYDDKVTLMRAFSHEAAGYWHVECPKRVGLLYVDGDHTKAGAKRDILVWAPHLAEGARIAVDDYGHPDWPGVGEAVDELVAEGVLEPIQLFHDRLAVTRHATLAGKAGTGKNTVTGRVTAITSEGVITSPDEADVLFGGTSPTVPGQVAVEKSEPIGPLVVDDPGSDADTEVSTWWDRAAEGELDGVPAGTEVYGMNLSQLKALAKKRGITLGARKDLRASILQALRDGR